jgi:hypothetical protein
MLSDKKQVTVQANRILQKICKYLLPFLNILLGAALRLLVRRHNSGSRDRIEYTIQNSFH